MRREKNQISKIRNATVEITTNITEIQEIIRDYFESLYSNKLENFEETYIFLATYSHPKLIQEDISHLNISVTKKKCSNQVDSQQKIVKDLIDSLLNSIKCLKN
jgi:hypothetical protein